MPESMLDLQTMLTCTQAAHTLGVSEGRVRALARGGRLACLVSPLGRLYDPEDVARLRSERAAAQQRSTPAGAAG
jgi:hypothetical protein